MAVQACEVYGVDQCPDRYKCLPLEKTQGFACFCNPAMLYKEGVDCSKVNPSVLSTILYGFRALIVIWVTHYGLQTLLMLLKRRYASSSIPAVSLWACTSQLCASLTLAALSIVDFVRGFKILEWYNIKGQYAMQELFSIFTMLSTIAITFFLVKKTRDANLISFRAYRITGILFTGCQLALVLFAIYRSHEGVVDQKARSRKLEVLTHSILGLGSACALVVTGSWFRRSVHHGRGGTPAFPSTFNEARAHLHVSKLVLFTHKYAAWMTMALISEGIWVMMDLKHYVVPVGFNHAVLQALQICLVMLQKVTYSFLRPMNPIYPLMPAPGLSRRLHSIAQSMWANRAVDANIMWRPQCLWKRGTQRVVPVNNSPHHFLRNRWRPHRSNQLHHFSGRWEAQQTSINAPECTTPLPIPAIDTAPPHPPL